MLNISYKCYKLSVWRIWNVFNRIQIPLFIFIQIRSQILIRIEIFSWIRIRIWILIRWMGSTALVRIRITFIQYANIFLLLQKNFKKNLKAWIASIRTTRTLRYDFMFVVAAFLHNATSSSCFRRCRARFDLPFELSISSSCVSWNWYLFVSNVFEIFP